MSGKALTVLLLLSSTLRGEITNLSDGIYTEAQAEERVELYATYVLIATCLSSMLIFRSYGAV